MSGKTYLTVSSVLSLLSGTKFVSGNGLKNFDKRMAEIGGKVSIESEVGKGTKLTFKIPTSGNE